MNLLSGFSIPTVPSYNVSNIGIFFFNQAMSSERTQNHDVHFFRIFCCASEDTGKDKAAPQRAVFYSVSEQHNYQRMLQCITRIKSVTVSNVFYPVSHKKFQQLFLKLASNI